ncbi:MAG: JDVT-CTERM domain-containing protein [Burkholderiales bacterium]
MARQLALYPIAANLGSSKVGGIDTAGKVNVYKLRADDTNDTFRAHDLIEETSGLMWLVDTPNSAPVVTGASTAPANTTAEAFYISEVTLDANIVTAPAPDPATPTAPSTATQNAGGGGCAAESNNQPDPTLALLLPASLIFVRKKPAP